MQLDGNFMEFTKGEPFPLTEMSKALFQVRRITLHQLWCNCISGCVCAAYYDYTTCDSDITIRLGIPFHHRCNTDCYSE